MRKRESGKKSSGDDAAGCIYLWIIGLLGLPFFLVVYLIGLSIVGIVKKLTPALNEKTMMIAAIIGGVIIAALIIGCLVELLSGGLEGTPTSSEDNDEQSARQFTHHW